MALGVLTVITKEEDTQASKRIDGDEQPSLLQLVHNIVLRDFVHIDQMCVVKFRLRVGRQLRRVIAQAIYHTFMGKAHPYSTGWLSSMVKLGQDYRWRCLNWPNTTTVEISRGNLGRPFIGRSRRMGNDVTGMSRVAGDAAK